MLENIKKKLSAKARILTQKWLTLFWKSKIRCCKWQRCG